jgi:thioredoxin 1
MLPHFLALTSAFPRLKYAVAQVDFMEAAARGVTYTPTFSVFRRGRRVDSFYGSNQQQLRDHLWLHNDRED